MKLNLRTTYWLVLAIEEIGTWVSWHSYDLSSICSQAWDTLYSNLWLGVLSGKNKITWRTYPKNKDNKTRTKQLKDEKKGEAWWGYGLGLKYYLWSCRAGSQIYCHMLACMRQSCPFLLRDCFISLYKKIRDVRLMSLKINSCPKWQLALNNQDSI